ncbi:hypothetical protein [Nostoc sp. ChiVER01]|uniref:hypothetical protein n=1 Tax=Nostoc sp. ChiVER01 TaxID=3075382 RepID=UPI002AD2D602|nr:hypothetical protein [Nostoc sp. ChiVER01]MDZ8225718.1 hypothetical protein [Nostoc sp. ChiVER01]
MFKKLQQPQAIITYKNSENLGHNLFAWRYLVTHDIFHVLQRKAEGRRQKAEGRKLKLQGIKPSQKRIGWKSIATKGRELGKKADFLLG